MTSNIEKGAIVPGIAAIFFAFNAFKVQQAEMEKLRHEIQSLKM